MRQGQELLQPVEALAAKGLDLLPILATADDATDRDGNDVDEQMSLAALDARVLEFAEILLDGKLGGHDSLLERPRNASYSR
jgi:hypothetical protein